MDERYCNIPDAFLKKGVNNQQTTKDAASKESKTYNICCIQSKMIHLETFFHDKL